MYANLLMARAGSTAGDLPDERSDALASLIDEASKRWNHRSGHPAAINGDSVLPNSLLALPPTQRYAVVVDLTAGRLYVIENQDGALRVVRDVYATIVVASSAKDASNSTKSV